VTATALLAMPPASLPLAEKLTLTLVVDANDTRSRDDLLGDLPTLVPFFERKLRVFDPAMGSVCGYVRTIPCACIGVHHRDTLALDLEVSFPFALLPGDARRRLLVYMVALHQR
jgi:hypothetical protein